MVDCGPLLEKLRRQDEEIKAIEENIARALAELEKRMNDMKKEGPYELPWDLGTGALPWDIDPSKKTRPYAETVKDHATLLEKKLNTVERLEERFKNLERIKRFREATYQEYLECRKQETEECAKNVSKYARRADWADKGVTASAWTAGIGLGAGGIYFLGPFLLPAAPILLPTYQGAQ